MQIHLDVFVKAKLVLLLIHEPMNNQLNFDHPQGPRSLEAGRECARNTKGAFMEG